MSARLAPPAPRRRTTRNERVVLLRSSMPLQLVTLRHDVPDHAPWNQMKTTPKVVVEPPQPSAEPSTEAGPEVDDETTAGKGGDARW